MSRHSYLLLVALAVTGCFAGGIAHAATYYLNSTSGTDSNNGTSSSTPWQTISKVNSTTFQAGDTILFQGGETFIGSLDFNASSSGTEPNPITVGSYGAGRASINSATSTGLLIHNTAGFIVKDLIFVGAGAASGTGNGIEFLNDLNGSTTLDYINIDDVDVSGYYGIGIAILGNNGDSGYRDITIESSTAHDNGDTGVEMIGSNFTDRNIFSNVLVDHVTAYNNTGQNASDPVGPDDSAPPGSGIFLQNVDGGTIQYSDAYNNDTMSDGGVGIWTATSNDITIQFNEAAGTGGGGEGLDFDGGMTNSVMQYNYSHDNSGGGVLLYQWYGTPGPPSWSDNTMRYNISQDDGTAQDGGASINVSAANAGQSMSGIAIYNNTLYNNNGTSSAVMSFAGTPGTNLTGIIANNIFYSADSSTPLIDDGGTNPSNLSFRGNDYFGGGQIRWNGAVYTSMGAWQASTSQEEISGSNVGLTGDPQLEAPGGGGTTNGYNPLDLSAYKLMSSSPMINAGLNLSSQFSIDPGSQDFYGTTIPSGGYYDIGAYAYTQTSTPLTTITAPSNGSTVSGSVVVSASSSAVAPASLSSVQFYLDGSPLGSALISAPYAITWNTAQTSNGIHSLTALATDNYGNTATSSAVMVTVANAAISSPASAAVGVSAGYAPYGWQVGSPPPGASLSTSSSSSLPSSSTTTLAEFNELEAKLASLLAEAGQTSGFGSSSSSSISSSFFPRNLSFRMTGTDVENLQQFLVNQASGPAAQKLKNHGVTRYFGILTFEALVEFQKKEGITPDSGYFGPKTRGVVNGMDGDLK